jgi:CO/xanthine dehydrogenase Mo-binding subunit
MSKKFKYVGSTFPCDDAVRKVTGDLAYGSDMRLPNMLHAKLLLSSIPHGIVKNIDTSKAEKVPGVIRIFSHLNAPDKMFSSYRIIPGQKMSFADEPLFTKRVKYVGDRVAAVVATSLATAREAVSLIEIEYEELPALLTPEEALNNEEVKIHPWGNLAHEYVVDVGELPSAVEDCIITESETRTQRTHHGAIEPHGCLAYYDTAGKLTVWTPTQSVYGVRTVVADFFNMNYSDVRVIKVPMGGSFGGKQEFLFETVTSFMAMETKRPVKLILDREECIIHTRVRPAVKSRIKTMVTKSGKLQELIADSTLNSGAYSGATPDYAVTLSQKVCKLYRIPHYKHSGRAVYTNTVRAGGFRGWGAPEIITAVEVHMDQVAKKLEMDPVEFRPQNLVHPYDMDPVVNLSLGDARVIECLEKGAEAFHWKERYNSQQKQGRYRRGVGVACGAHKNGMYGGFLDCTTMFLKMNEDGSLNLNASIHDVGCGIGTVMKIIVAEVLDIDPDLITVTEADTELTGYDPGVYGSRVTYVVGACAKKTAEMLKSQILDNAAVILNKPKEYLRVENGYVVTSGEAEQRAISYKEIAEKAIQENYTSLSAAYTHHSTSNPGSYSVQFAEVLVDTMTGLTSVTDFLAVCDVGRALNRGMIEGQFQGAAQMGIGYALCEEVRYNAQGQPMSNSFTNYHMLTAKDMPDVKVLLIEHEGDDGPFGAKSVGEISNVPTAAAVINAVNNALGTFLTDMPLTPEKILAAL